MTCNDRSVLVEEIYLVTPVRLAIWDERQVVNAQGCYLANPVNAVCKVMIQDASLAAVPVIADHRRYIVLLLPFVVGAMTVVPIIMNNNSSSSSSSHNVDVLSPVAKDDDDRNVACREISNRCHHPWLLLLVLKMDSHHHRVIRQWCQSSKRVVLATTTTPIIYPPTLVSHPVPWNKLRLMLRRQLVVPRHVVVDRARSVTPFHHRQDQSARQQPAARSLPIENWKDNTERPRTRRRCHLWQQNKEPAIRSASSRETSGCKSCRLRPIRDE
mmetsp:Transcript_5606/g.9276  ORF Transcript_5606/g.9276 Transcript_5606/m.9276 type:complete len:271 (+) Transcript_5606:719-1531(+)